jgi:predicted SnoaL-like aldol condensation-catalyzing enzyme
MGKQSMFGWMAALGLLLSLSVAACIQPITAVGVQTEGTAVAQASAGETTEAINEAAIQGWFDAVNAHDLRGIEQAIDKYYAADYVLHDPTVPNFSGGTATLKLLVRESMQALPDVQITVEDLIAQGDSVAIRVTVSGTQPDGQPLHFFTMSMIRFVDGQFAEEWQLAEAVGEEVVGSDIGAQK